MNMKWMFVVCALLCAVCCVSCGQEDKQTPVTREDVQKSIEQAASTTKSYLDQQKEEFDKEMKESLDKLDAQLKELAVKVEKAGTATDQKLREEVDSLRKQSETAREKLNGAEDSSSDTWEKIKVEARNSVKELKEAVDITLKKLD